MSRQHSTQPGLGQEALFVIEPLPDAPGQYYPSVSIEHRAQVFQGIFNLVNQVRSAEGLEKRAATSIGRLALEGQYGRSLEEVLAGSARKTKENKQTIRLLFEHAYGVPEMDRAGYDGTRTREEVELAYRLFTRAHGLGQPDKAVRDKQARQIQASADAITGNHYVDSRRTKPRRAA